MAQLSICVASVYAGVTGDAVTWACVSILWGRVEMDSVRTEAGRCVKSDRRNRIQQQVFGNWGRATLTLLADVEHHWVIDRAERAHVVLQHGGLPGGRGHRARTTCGGFRAENVC